MSQSHVWESGHSFSSNINSFNTIVNGVSSADSKAEILEWLSTREPRAQHAKIRARRVGGVGGWLFRTEEYQNWLGGIHGGEPNNSVLFCYGDPWVGKTYIG